MSQDQGRVAIIERFYGQTNVTMHGGYTPRTTYLTVFVYLPYIFVLPSNLGAMLIRYVTYLLSLFHVLYATQKMTKQKCLQVHTTKNFEKN